MNRIRFGAAALAASVAFGAQSAVIFNLSGPGGRAAQASFDIVGSNLVITLTNTATHDVMNSSELLTGVYWSVSGGPLGLGRVSAALNAGSFVAGNVPTPAVDPLPNGVGGEWAYRGGLSGAPGGNAYGISSSGLGLFGPGDRFPGANLQGPTSPDGAQYGITSAGDNTATGNGGLLNDAWVKNSVVFTLSGLPQGFSLNQIGNVWVQYGTDLAEPSFPTPGSLSLLVLAGAIAGRRRR